MENEKEPTGEERELLELFSKSILNDYPNPERSGCPGDAFLRQLATDRKSVPLRDARLEHVLHCSPCFREFAGLRQAGRKPFSRRAVGAALVAAASLIVAFWLSGIFVHRTGPGEIPQNAAPIIAQISLQDRSVVRGVQKDPQKLEALHVPRGQLTLTVLLPFGSEAGKYEIQILRDVENPLLKASGKAEIADGITKLIVAVNTERLAKGEYLLGVRRPPFDWAYNRIAIK